MDRSFEIELDTNYDCIRFTADHLGLHYLVNGIYVSQKAVVKQPIYVLFLMCLNYAYIEKYVIMNETPPKLIAIHVNKGLSELEGAYFFT